MSEAIYLHTGVVHEMLYENVTECGRLAASKRAPIHKVSEHEKHILFDGIKHGDFKICTTCLETWLAKLIS